MFSYFERYHFFTFPFCRFRSIALNFLPCPTSPAFPPPFRILWIVIIKFFFLAFSRLVVLVCGPSSLLVAFLEANFSRPSRPSAACWIRSSRSCLAFLRGPRMAEGSMYSSFVESALRLLVSLNRRG
jgi:hypothetical protein